MMTLIPLQCNVTLRGEYVLKTKEVLCLLMEEWPMYVCMCVCMHCTAHVHTSGHNMAIMKGMMVMLPLEDMNFY